jgi:hypothetical protein
MPCTKTSCEAFADLQMSQVMISSFLIESDSGLMLITSRFFKAETEVATFKLRPGQHMNTYYIFYIDYIVAKPRWSGTQ